ncbi:MAG: ATP-dependent RNA helicase HrpA, partial [Pseudomonadales bacterium]
MEKLSDAVKKSFEWTNQRRSQIPVIRYPELPIAAEVDHIKQLLSDNQVIVVAGETGSGKTTQLPKICLELGLGSRGLIAHTQPRRVAARTVAARIAEELETTLGSLVGYQVRFTDQSSPNTLVKLMTDGILLSEIQRDPYLRNYECIIIDEAHERSINIDFLLGYLKQLLPKRPDLKLIITSATIDFDRFSEHFDSAPVVEVSGRTFPVEIFYRPWEEEYESPVDAVVGQVKNIIETEPLSHSASDILVFCTGERDIRELALALRRAQLKNLDILPLYSRLSVAEQDRVFKTGSGRRVVLATNVAETSLTVPGIGFVIDTGTARISRYSVRTKVQRLPIEPVSQASANQRAGRCGRIAEGICIRLYSEQDFASRDEFTPPEIMRTNLAAVILQMQNLKLGEIADFPFVERPQDKQIRDGLRLLEELSLVDADDQITQLGRLLSGLPVDPRFARILWQAQKDQCLAEAITIVSALSIQDPRERPADKQQQADEKHRVFMDKESDFNAILNIWNAYQENRQNLSNRKLDDWCRKHFLSPLRMREWREVHFQLSLMSRELGWKTNQNPPDYKSLHRALLSGLITQIGVQQENKEFLGTRNRRFRIFPGSYLAKKPPKWVFSAQMLDTSQLFAHQVAKLDPEWLLGIADHALQTDYYEPFYHVRRGEIMARMRYSLFGLVISDRHKVSYKTIEPDICHELFIREALANWKYRGKGVFFQHNRDICDRLEELEDRTRSGKLMVDEEQLFQFYLERIPAGVNDQASFEAWRAEAETKNPNILFLDEESLTASVDQEKLIEFPDSLEWQGLNFQLSYKFQPGSEEDGVTLHVPVDQLHQVPEHLVEWLVPGLLKDKLVAVLKSLPKRYRRELVPIPAHV